MLTVAIVILVVSGALVIGALWGAFLSMPRQVEGFLIAIAGGALILSLVSELIEPAIHESSLTNALIWTGVGAVVFTGIDYLIDEYWGANNGGGLLAAITLDGVPENLALGVALIGAGPLQVAALAGSIFLSNFPEAAGGAKEMKRNGMGKKKIIGLWGFTALILSIAALAGYFALANADPVILASIKCFAAGAVVASLATEVFPTAFKDDHHAAGIATVIGLILALALSELG